MPSAIADQRRHHHQRRTAHQPMRQRLADHDHGQALSGQRQLLQGSIVRIALEQRSPATAATLAAPPPRAHPAPCLAAATAAGSSPSGNNVVTIKKNTSGCSSCSGRRKLETQLAPHDQHEAPAAAPTLIPSSSRRRTLRRQLQVVMRDHERRGRRARHAPRAAATCSSDPAASRLVKGSSSSHSARRRPARAPSPRGAAGPPTAPAPADPRSLQRPVRSSARRSSAARDPPLEAHHEAQILQRGQIALERRLVRGIGERALIFAARARRSACRARPRCPAPGATDRRPPAAAWSCRCRWVPRHAAAPSGLSSRLTP